jgi:hypothetical protein
LASPSAAAPESPAEEAAAPAFPLARVRKIIKAGEEKDAKKMSGDGVVAVAFSTVRICCSGYCLDWLWGLSWDLAQRTRFTFQELFLGYLLEKAQEYAVREKRKTIMYKDVSRAVADIEQLEFLRGERAQRASVGKGRWC